MDLFRNLLPTTNNERRKINSNDDFQFSLHSKYFSRCLTILPSQTSSLDNSRVTVAFYSLSGLDLLKSLPKSLPYNSSELISWIYRLQLINDSDASGFRGSSCSITSRINPNPYDHIHITMTMTALLSLLLLGDDLENVERSKIAASLVHLQLPNGAFLATRLSTENDLRFVYCACVVAFILNDWSGINKDLCTNFILQCRTYEYAFGQTPGAEAHGGSTFCAVASLSLMNRLDDLDHQDDLIRWCLQRQNEGFNGRPNKPDDSCYSWWIGATLKLLEKDFLINIDEIQRFLHATESKVTGGFSKWPDSTADPLHGYLSLAALSLMKHENLKSIHPALIVSMDIVERLQSDLHPKWNK
jgi:geranylgeranyl transferase type-1 subunit beta